MPRWNRRGSRCPICLDDKEMQVLACKHALCSDCLVSYVECPGPKRRSLRTTLGYQHGQLEVYQCNAISSSL